MLTALNRPPPTLAVELFYTETRACAYVNTYTAHLDDDCLPPRDISPHQDSTGTAPSSERYTAAGTAAPTTIDTGTTVPQRTPTPLRWPMLTNEGPGLAFTRYCYYQYCIVYSIPKGGRGGVVYCPIAVRWYCNRVGNAGGPEE